MESRCCRAPLGPRGSEKSFRSREAKLRRARYRVFPSVAMKGATPAFATSQPFNSQPRGKPAVSAVSQERPEDNGPCLRAMPCVSKYPATIPPSPATEPTERSIPPVRTTKVMPMARIAEMATCFDRMARLLAVRNDGASAEKSTRSATRTKTARARRRKRSVRTVDAQGGQDDAAGGWQLSCELNS